MKFISVSANSSKRFFNQWQFYLRASLGFSFLFFLDIKAMASHAKHEEKIEQNKIVSDSKEDKTISQRTEEIINLLNDMDAAVDNDLVYFYRERKNIYKILEKIDPQNRAVICQEILKHPLFSSERNVLGWLGLWLKMSFAAIDGHIPGDISKEALTKNLDRILEEIDKKECSLALKVFLLFSLNQEIALKAKKYDEVDGKILEKIREAMQGHYFPKFDWSESFRPLISSKEGKILLKAVESELNYEVSLSDDADQFFDTLGPVLGDQSNQVFKRDTPFSYFSQIKDRITRKNKLRKEDITTIYHPGIYKKKDLHISDEVKNLIKGEPVTCSIEDSKGTINLGYFLYLPNNVQDTKAIVVMSYGGHEKTDVPDKLEHLFGLNNIEHVLLSNNIGVIHLNTPDLELNDQFQRNMDESVFMTTQKCLNTLYQKISSDPKNLSDKLKALKKDIPLYLSGPSFGGLMAARHAELFPKTYRGYISHDGSLDYNGFKEYLKPMNMQAKITPEIKDNILILQNYNDNIIKVKDPLSYLEKLKQQGMDQYADVLFFKEGNVTADKNAYIGHFHSSSNTYVDLYADKIISFIEKTSSSKGPFVFKNNLKELRSEETKRNYGQYMIDKNKILGHFLSVAHKIYTNSLPADPTLKQEIIDFKQSFDEQIKRFIIDMMGNLSESALERLYEMMGLLFEKNFENKDLNAIISIVQKANKEKKYTMPVFLEKLEKLMAELDKSSVSPQTMKDTQDIQLELYIHKDEWSQNELPLDMTRFFEDWFRALGPLSKIKNHEAFMRLALGIVPKETTEKESLISTAWDKIYYPALILSIMRDKKMSDEDIKYIKKKMNGVSCGEMIKPYKSRFMGAIEELLKLFSFPEEGKKKILEYYESIKISGCILNVDEKKTKINIDVLFSCKKSQFRALIEWLYDFYFLHDVLKGSPFEKKMKDALLKSFAERSSSVKKTLRDQLWKAPQIKEKNKALRQLHETVRTLKEEKKEVK